MLLAPLVLRTLERYFSHWYSTVRGKLLTLNWLGSQSWGILLGRVKKLPPELCWGFNTAAWSFPLLVGPQCKHSDIWMCKFKVFINMLTCSNGMRDWMMSVQSSCFLLLRCISIPFCNTVFFWGWGRPLHWLVMVATSQWDCLSSGVVQLLVGASQTSAALCALGFCACCVKWLHKWLFAFQHWNEKQIYYTKENIHFVLLFLNVIIDFIFSFSFE